MILNKVTDCYLTKDGKREEIQDDKLYKVVTDLYTGQMLGSVTDVSYGLLKIEPKDKNGKLIKNLEDEAITYFQLPDHPSWEIVAAYRKGHYISKPARTLIELAGNYFYSCNTSLAVLK